MQQEIESSLIQRINSTYEEFCELAKSQKQTQIDGANKARESGLLLLEFKKHCPHGEFTRKFKSHLGKYIAENIFVMSYEHGSQLMRIANRYDEPFDEGNYPERARSLHDLLYTANELEMPNGHGPQNVKATHQNAFAEFSRHLMAFRTAWDKHGMRHPIQQWTRETAMQFVSELEPIIEEVNEIYAMAKTRAENT
jgi:hypothetical protein